MASIKQSKNGTITVRWDRDDWFRGLMPNHGASNYASREGDGLSWVTSVNPWREPGYLLPGFQAEEVSGIGSITNDATILNIASASYSGNVFGHAIENATKFHQINIFSGSVTTSGGDFPRTLAGTDPVGSDCITYSISGVEHVFYTYNDSTSGRVGKFTPPATFVDPFTPVNGSLTLDRSYAHPMIVGDNDILYIANGSQIVAYDGVNDVGDTISFKVPDGQTISSFAKLPNYLVVYCSSKKSADAAPGNSYAYFWDYASEDATSRYDLNCAYVNGGFSYKSSVGVFGQRQSFSGNKHFLLIFNGSTFETVASTIEQIPGHGGVDIMDEMIVWNAGDFGGLGTSRIYSYGTIGKGFDNALQQIGSGLGTSSGGALFASGSSFTTGILASFGQGQGELNSFTGGFAESLAYSGLKDIVFGRNGMGKVMGVKVVYKKKITAGSSFTLRLNTDSSGTTTDRRGTPTTLVSSETSLDKLIKHYDFASDGSELPQFSNSIGWSCSWRDNDTEAHGIQSIEIYIKQVKSES